MTSHVSSLTQLAHTDPEFYQFLKENDLQLLQFSGDESVGGSEDRASVESDASDGVESDASDGVESDASEGVESDASDGVESDASDGVESDASDSVGVPEPRPLHVTSRREVSQYLAGVECLSH